MNTLIGIYIVSVIIRTGCALVYINIIVWSILTASEASQNLWVPHWSLRWAQAIVISWFNFLARNGFLVKLTPSWAYYIVITSVLFVIKYFSDGAIYALSRT